MLKAVVGLALSNWHRASLSHLVFVFWVKAQGGKIVRVSGATRDASAPTLSKLGVLGWAHVVRPRQWYRRKDPSYTRIMLRSASPANWNRHGHFNIWGRWGITVESRDNLCVVLGATVWSVKLTPLLSEIPTNGHKAYNWNLPIS